jgi:hypothetical protein
MKQVDPVERQQLGEKGDKRRRPLSTGDYFILEGALRMFILT